MIGEKASTVLTRARDIISDPQNWAKGDYNIYDCDTENTSYCALGAVGQAMGLDMNNDYESELAIFGHPGKYLRLSVPPRRASEAPSVMDYNDMPCTTHEDILSLFDKAIALARQTEEVGGE